MPMNKVLGLAAVVLSLATALLAQAEDVRHVRIINETSHTMMRFYALSAGKTSWEEDMLGESTLAPGASVVINIDDGTGYCLYDFKGVLDDKDEVIKSRIDVCKDGSLRFTEG